MGFKQQVKGALEKALPEAAFERLDRGVDMARYEAFRRRWARSAGNPTKARGTILFYPRLPTEWHSFWKLAAATNHHITDDPAADGIVAAIRFYDRTDWVPDEALRAVAKRLPVANLECNDISKSHVNDVFAETFEYELGVDPLTHDGTMVVKSEENATHDGRFVEGPIGEREPEMSYQRYVNARPEEGADHIVVLRTPIVGADIPLVYRKYRTLEHQLSNEKFRVTMHATDEVYSEEERAQILAFCAAFNLDLGEIDVLRDLHDGRIYIVDANNTPWGPPRGMPEADERRAIELQVDAFQRLLDRGRG